MGIHDRDYIRERSTVAEMAAAGRLTLVLMAVYVVIWVVTAGMLRSGSPSGTWVFAHLALEPHRTLRGGEMWRVLTAPWMHLPHVGHLLFNMVVFFWVGRRAEALLGRGRYLSCCLSSSVVLALVFAVIGLVLDGSAHAAVGMDALLCVLLAMVAFHRPRDPVRPLGLFRVPLALVAGVLIVGLATTQYSLHRLERGGLQEAMLIPLGGIACVVAVGLGWFWYRLGASVPGGAPSSPMRRKTSVRAPGSVASAASDTVGDESRGVRERVDVLLAKISSSGMEALTTEERSFLQDASRKFGARK